MCCIAMSSHSRWWIDTCRRWWRWWALPNGVTRREWAGKGVDIWQDCLRRVCRRKWGWDPWWWCPRRTRREEGRKSQPIWSHSDLGFWRRRLQRRCRERQRAQKPICRGYWTCPNGNATRWTPTSMRINERIVAPTVPAVFEAIARDWPLPASSVSAWTRSTTSVSIMIWAPHCAVFRITPMVNAVL